MLIANWGVKTLGWFINSIPIILRATAVFAVGECALDEPQTGSLK